MLVLFRCSGSVVLPRNYRQPLLGSVVRNTAVNLLCHLEVLRACASGYFTAVKTGGNDDPVWRSSTAKTAKSCGFGSHWPSLGSKPATSAGRDDNNMTTK